MDPLTVPTVPTVPTAAPSAAGARPGIRLRWPPGFHELPVAAGPVDRGQRIEALLDALLPADPGYDQLRGHAREHYARLADHQQQHGILAAALCNGRIGERVTGAYVSLSLVPLSYPSAEVAALGIYRVLSGDTDADTADGADDADGDDADREANTALDEDTAGRVLDDGRYVAGVRLPAGPAVVVTDLRTVTDGRHPDADPASTPAGVLQIQLPAPGLQCLLVITLMTPFLEDFPAYSQDAAALAMSIRFTHPAPAPHHPPAGRTDPPTGLLGTAALDGHGPPAGERHQP